MDTTQLITNGDFSNKTLAPWTTTIVGEVQYDFYEKGGFSILLPRNTSIQQIIEKPLPVSPYRMDLEFTARVAPQAKSDTSWLFFFVVVYPEVAPNLFVLNKSWQTFKHTLDTEWPIEYPPTVTVTNVNGEDGEGTLFNEPIQITNIKMHLL